MYYDFFPIVLFLLKSLYKGFSIIQILFKKNWMRSIRKTKKTGNLILHASNFMKHSSNFFINKEMMISLKF
jgi:hypothetical protein